VKERVPFRIRLDLGPHPEFDAWHWAEFARVAVFTIEFKREIDGVPNVEFRAFRDDGVLSEQLS
jgi:hypothetical protein